MCICYLHLYCPLSEIHICTLPVNAVNPGDWLKIAHYLILLMTDVHILHSCVIFVISSWFVSVFLHLYLSVFSVHISVRAFICICACVCVCVCMSVCILGSILCEQEFDSVGVDEKARKGAVLICVPSMDLPSVQLHTHFIAHIQMQDHTVGSVVVILISILSNGAGSYLSPTEDIHTDN